MSIGGIVASGIAGAIAGAGEGASQNSILEQKAEIDRMRDEQIARLAQSTHAANAKFDADNKLAMTPLQGAADTAVKAGDISGTAAPIANAAALKIDTTAQPEANAAAAKITATSAPEAQAAGAKAGAVDNAVARKLGPGESLLNPGTTDIAITGPSNRTPAQEAETTALANRYNAEADFYRSGLKGAKKEILPHIIKSKDSNGQDVLLDENSGAIGYPVEGSPAVPEKPRWFRSNDPAKPEVLPSIRWVDSDGKTPLPNGLEDKYKILQKNATSASGGAAPSGGIVNSATGGGSAGSFDEARTNGGKVTPKTMASNTSRQVDVLNQELQTELGSGNPNPANVTALQKEIASFTKTGAKYAAQVPGAAPAMPAAPAAPTSVPPGIPAGSMKFGTTPQGATVWLSPDGKKWTE